MTIWKRAAKYWWEQWRLWRDAYNQIADIHMIDESWSAAPDDVTIVIRCDGGVPGA